MSTAKLLAVKPLNQYPTALMTEEQTKALMSCMIADPNKLQALSADMEAQRNFLWMVFTKRAKSVGLNLELNLVAFVVLALLDNPAQSTQMVHAIYHDVIRRAPRCTEQDVANVEQLKIMYTLSDFVNMFPMGVPSETSYEKAWDDQKQSPDSPGGDNKLDTEKFFNVWTA